MNSTLSAFYGLDFLASTVILLRDAPKVTTHQRLLQLAWGEGSGDMAALHTQVYELRNMLDRPFTHPMIQSVRGIGYRLVDSP